MKTQFARALLVLAAAFVLATAPLQAHANRCSQASAAGSWAYTYSGTIFTPSGPVPAAAVGHYKQDAEGNAAGSQTRSVGGVAAVEDVVGTIAINKDCTGTATVKVFVNGVLQRTAVLAVAYDSDGNHIRMIFQSLTLPDGTNVPVVLTFDGNRLFSND
jgi:hypothetical protein